MHEIYGDDVRGRWTVVYTFAIETADGRRERPGCALVEVRDGAIVRWREYAG